MMQSGWHSADIITGLKICGTSLLALSHQGASVFYTGKCAYPPLVQR